MSLHSIDISQAGLTDAIVIEDTGESIIEGISGGNHKPVGFIVNCPVVYRIN